MTKKRFLILICLAALFSFFFLIKSNEQPTASHFTSNSISNSALENLNQNSKNEILITTSQVTKTINTTSSTQKSNSCIDKFDKDIFTAEKNFEFRKKMNQTLNSFVGEWFYMKGALPRISNTSSSAEKFFYALASAHLLIGLKIQPKLDRKLSLKLLSEVARSDPQNSAPKLYAALIYEEIKDYESSKRLIKQTSVSSAYFSSYILDFLKALTLTASSGEEFYRTLAIRSTHPVPDYLKLKNLIIKYNLQYISEQLVKDALNKERFLIDYEWSALDYSIGVSTLKKLNPEYKLPLIDELIAIKNKFHGLEANRSFKDFQKDCNLIHLENEFVFLKSRLINN